MSNALTTVRLCAVTAGLVLGAASAWAAPTTDVSIQARYERDRAACLSGRTGEDRATCLKEAGAARDEARRGKLDKGDSSELRANAVARCAPLAGDDKLACEARMAGMGKVSGSVEGGGVLREVKIRKVEPPPR